MKTSLLLAAERSLPWSGAISLRGQATGAATLYRNELLADVAATRIVKPAPAPQAGHQAAPQGKGKDYVQQDK